MPSWLRGPSSGSTVVATPVMLDLFSGIGGFSLAGRWAGFVTVKFVEIDPYCQRVLAKHWPGVPIHDDIRTFDPKPLAGAVDLITGGFPCQDISNAGRRAGIDGQRSGLWAEMARVIGLVRPRYVLVENVTALLGRGMGRVLGDLSAIGYDAEWHVIPAAAVGAPHLRERVWIVAHPNAAGVRWGEGWAAAASSAGQSCGLGDPLPDADRQGLAVGQGVCGHACQEQSAAFRGDWWATEPDVGRVATRVPARLDRLRGLGNAIVPQVAYGILRVIAEKMT